MAAKKRAKKTEGERPRARPATKKRPPSNVAFVVTVLLVALAGAASIGLYFVYPGSHGGGAADTVRLSLTGEESPSELADKLASAGLVASPRVFALYVKASGRGGVIAPGVHLLPGDATPGDLVERIAHRGGGPKTKVVFPEGWTRFDMAKRLEEKRIVPRDLFLAATTDGAVLADLRIDAPSAEGFLFPATYDLAEDSDAADVVRRLKSEFDKRYAALEAKHPGSIHDLAESVSFGRNQIVTLASMVEKEAVVDDERPIIAGVFLNRLRDPLFVPHLLQCDPTAGYGCVVAKDAAPSCAAYAGKITHDIVADAQNPYNTYKHEGLPPGPIANPGAKSLEAAMAPTPSRYFYFVAKGGGRHAFSETLGAHNAAVSESNVNAKPKPLGGKDGVPE